MRPDELSTRIRAGTAPAVLDVRSRLEFRRGHIPGARHMPLWAVLVRASALPFSRGDLAVVYCGHGPRAALASLALRLRGFQRVVPLEGHMAAWRKAGLPEE